MADYKLEIFTQEKKAFSAEVTAITLPGEDGYLGVLAHHAPLITVLGEGKLTVRQGQQTSEFHLSGGFLEVHENKATILTDRLDTGH